MAGTPPLRTCGMATMIIRDDALWARHIEGDPEIERRIRALAPDDPIVLKIEGRPMRFRKMRDSGPRPTDWLMTDGLLPDPASSPEWRALQKRRGGMVTVELEHGAAADPYLLSLAATLTEWNSPDDAAAYDGL